MNNEQKIPVQVSNCAAIIERREQVPSDVALQKAFRWYFKLHPELTPDGYVAPSFRRKVDKYSIEGVLRMLSRYEQRADPELGYARL